MKKRRFIYICREKQIRSMENRKRLWIFNPDCEMAIANGSKYYMPPANVVTMAEDLAVLPVFLGESEDWVLVRNLPDPVFMASVYEGNRGDGVRKCAIGWPNGGWVRSGRRNEKSGIAAGKPGKG